MENYIVRIYRHEKDKPHKLMGIVEKIGEEDKKAFTHIDELWAILNATKTKLKGSKREMRNSESRRRSL